MLRDRFGAVITVGSVITYPYRRGSMLKNVDALVTETIEAPGANRIKVKAIDAFAAGRIYTAIVTCIDRVTVLPYTKEEFYNQASVKMEV